MKNSILLAAAAATAVVMLSLNVEASAQSQQALLWCDEFNGTASTSVNDAYWSVRTNENSADMADMGWGSLQLQTYTDDASNVAVVDGEHLAITVVQTGEGDGAQFTSGRVDTCDKVHMQYGTVSARIFNPPQAITGINPSFWTLGTTKLDYMPSNGQIAVMDVGQGIAAAEGVDDERVVSSATWEVNNGRSTAAGWLGCTDFDDDYYVFTLDWTPTTITTYRNDDVIFTMNIDPATCNDCEEFHQAHCIGFNVAVGGGFASPPLGDTPLHNCALPATNGGRDGECGTVLQPAQVTVHTKPATMKVDWVRIHDNGHCRITVVNNEPGPSEPAEPEPAQPDSTPVAPSPIVVEAGSPPVPTPVSATTPVSTPVMASTPVSTPVMASTPVSTPVMATTPVSTPVTATTPVSTPAAAVPTPIVAGAEVPIAAPTPVAEPPVGTPVGTPVAAVPVVVVPTPVAETPVSTPVAAADPVPSTPVANGGDGDETPTEEVPAEEEGEEGSDPTTPSVATPVAQPPSSPTRPSYTFPPVSCEPSPAPTEDSIVEEEGEDEQQPPATAPAPPVEATAPSPVSAPTPTTEGAEEPGPPTSEGDEPVTPDATPSSSSVPPPPAAPSPTLDFRPCMPQDNDGPVNEQGEAESPVASPTTVATPAVAPVMATPSVPCIGTDGSIQYAPVAVGIPTSTTTTTTTVITIESTTDGNAENATGDCSGGSTMSVKQIQEAASAAASTSHPWTMVMSLAAAALVVLAF